MADIVEKVPFEKSAKEMSDFIKKSRRIELRRLEKAAKQFLRDTEMAGLADNTSIHAWMAAFAYDEMRGTRRLI